MKSTAIILSAGQGKRMNNTIAKQYLELGGKPILYYSLSTFSKSPEITNIVLVISEEDRDFVKDEIIGKYRFGKVSDIVVGGVERYHSVFNGLNALSVMDSDFIFIHDGARPLIDTEIISEAMRQVSAYPAIVVGMPAKDTIKRIDTMNMVCETPERETLWLVQTPQVFASSLIKEAYQALINNEHEIIKQGISITDDAMVVETFSTTKVKLIPGSYKNIKITTPEDLRMAEALV